MKRTGIDEIKEEIDGLITGHIDDLGELALKLHKSQVVDEILAIKQDLLLIRTNLYAHKYYVEEGRETENLQSEEIAKINNDLNEVYLYESERIKDVRSQCNDLIAYADSLIYKNSTQAEEDEPRKPKQKAKERGRPKACNNENFTTFLKCSTENKEKIIDILKAYYKLRSWPGVVEVIKVLEKREYYIGPLTKATLWASLQEIIEEKCSNENLNRAYRQNSDKVIKEKIKEQLP